MNLEKILGVIRKAWTWLTQHAQALWIWLARNAPLWFDALFVRDPAPQARWVPWAWFAGLYGVGIVFWGLFYNWGKINFNWHDWAEVSAARFAFVGNAVRAGVLPLHMIDATALRGITDRYLAIPDVTLSPQMLLMLFLDTGKFVLANTWILYTLGVIGLIWIARRYRLSPAAYSVVFLLFNFNGHITAHLSVGHTSWVGYFLFPWVVLLLLRLVEGAKSWGYVAAFSFLLFFLLLQGAYHQFVWCLVLLGLIGLLQWKYLPTVLKIGITTGLLSLVRLLPPTLELGKFSTDFISGYPSLLTLLQSLVTIQPPTDQLAVRELYNSLGWWELDLYVGLAGLAFLLYFGVWKWITSLNRPDDGRRDLFAPVAILSVLTIGPFWGYLVKVFPFPLLTSERVSSRILSLPFTLLLILAAIFFQETLERMRAGSPLRVAVLAGFVPLGNDLINHFRAWRPSVALKGFPVTPVDLSLKVVGNHPDPAYFRVLGIGLAVTVLTAAFLIFMAWRTRPRAEAGYFAPVAQGKPISRLDKSG